MKNIALLGFGKIGKTFFERSLKSPKITIENILKKKSINFKDKKIKFFKSISPLLKDKSIQGYIVATPVQSHFKYAKKIVKSKKPFIIEKPLVSTPNELNILYDLCKNYKKSIFVNHKDLYNPAFYQFNRELKSIGNYNKINISFGKFQKIKIPKIKNNFFLPSFDWLPHPLAIALKLEGYPKKISVIKNKFFFLKKYIFQNSIINLTYKKRIIQISFSNQYKTPRRRIEIKGSKARLIYDGYKKNMLIKKSNNENFKKIKYQTIDPFENLINKLYRSIDTKYYNNDVHLSYKVMKILFELDRVMKNGLNL